MVKLTLPLAVLAMASVVAAAPSQQSPKVFSFQAWVEDIIANPNTALTVDEAIAAAQTADVVGSAGGLRRRIDCRDHLPDEPRANARDAAACLDDLARKGRNGVNCVVSNFAIQFCGIRNAKVWGSASTKGESANCGDVARTGGLVFDTCWRSDDTVKGSEICVGNRRMQVTIHGA